MSLKVNFINELNNQKIDMNNLKNPYETIDFYSNETKLKLVDAELLQKSVDIIEEMLIQGQYEMDEELISDAKLFIKKAEE